MIHTNMCYRCRLKVAKNLVFKQFIAFKESFLTKLEMIKYLVKVLKFMLKVIVDNIQLENINLTFNINNSIIQKREWK